jgi:OmpA-OmpF porin, OOP family
MRKQRRFAAGLALWGLVVLVTGCSSWSFDPPMRGNVDFAAYNVGKVRAAVPATPGTFTQALTSDYAGLAGSLEDELKDWADADYFARKGLAAAGGEVVPPERNSNWLIPLEVPNKFRTELAENRERLVAALDGGGRKWVALVGARGQVR